ncbi:MAG: tetratricopeptide repeat protein, partial [Acidobacteriaceae bacterium]
AGERATRLLREAEASDPEQQSDSELHMELGFLEQINGDRVPAKAEYQRALNAEPFNETAASDLAVLDAQSGDAAAAVPLWQAVFQHDPGASAAGIDLAVAQCRGESAEAAAKTLRRVLLFAPDNDAARKFLLALTAGSQKCAQP